MLTPGVYAQIQLRTGFGFDVPQSQTLDGLED